MINKIATFAFSVAVGLSLAAVTAAAELTGAEMMSLLTNKTAYIQFSDSPLTGAGPGAIYYSPDGEVVAKFPNGSRLSGSTTIKDNASCIAWDGQSAARCSKLEKDGDMYKIISIENGRLRGTIVKIVDANPENL